MGANVPGDFQFVPGREVTLGALVVTRAAVRPDVLVKHHPVDTRETAHVTLQFFPQVRSVLVPVRDVLDERQLLGGGERTIRAPVHTPEFTGGVRGGLISVFLRVLALQMFFQSRLCVAGEAAPGASSVPGARVRSFVVLF